MAAILVNLIDVHRALEGDESVPSFQPLVELRTGQLAGCEVLMRWPHPQHGLVLPANFISLAEQHGLIGRLTQQMWRKAFHSAAVLPGGLTLAINVSPIQLRDHNLPNQIRVIAEETQFPLERLMIEITETSLVGDLDVASATAHELKAMGCRLGLDDFGTGYSSLRHLQALPFDQLKIDRSFVRSMTNTRESRTIVAAVIGLGRSLGLTTVAEGVETQDQADMLLWLGCDLGQGWLFGRPLAAEHLPDIVTAARPASPTRPLMRGTSSVFSDHEAQPSQRLAQLQAIYDGAPLGLCFLDRKLRYVSLNQRYADMNGFPLDAYIGRTVQEMIPEVFSQIEPYLHRALQGQGIADEEVNRPTFKSGEAGLITIVSYQPVLDGTSEVIGISVTAADITNCKRAEDALREIEDDRRHMLDLSPHLSWILDGKGNLLDVSAQWTQITGLSKEQARKLGWLEALHPADVQPTMKALREALYSGKPIDIEYRVRDADGNMKWMRARGAPRYGSSGEIIRWYGGAEEIDERKQLEDALRKTYAYRISPIRPK